MLYQFLSDCNIIIIVCSHTGGPSRSVLTVLRDIVRNEGPRHLMKGLLPRVLVVPMYMSVFYVFNEELEKRFIK